MASDGTSYFCLNGGIARYDRYRNYVDTTRVPLSLSQVRAYNRHENEFAPLLARERTHRKPVRPY